MEPAARVQHVAKASSDQLLTKFAELESESRPAKKELQRVSKRRKRGHLTARVTISDCKSPLNVNCNSRWMEKSSLLHPPPTQRSPVVVLRRLYRARDFKNGSILGTIGKTWRKTVEGASRVFVEKHYNRHKRLISDAV